MKKTLIFSIITALLYMGCASSEPKVSASEAKMVAGPPHVHFPYEIELDDIITLSSNDDCNEADFLLYARNTKKVHRLIDIAMKRTCSIYQSGGKKKEHCSCVYSGIGVKYKFSNAEKCESKNGIEEKPQK